MKCSPKRLLELSASRHVQPLPRRDTPAVTIFEAGLAQPVEQRTRNAQVLGSIPSASSNEIKGLSHRLFPPKRPILHFCYSLNLAHGDASFLRALLGYSQAHIFLNGVSDVRVASGAP